MKTRSWSVGLVGLAGLMVLGGCTLVSGLEKFSVRPGDGGGGGGAGGTGGGGNNGFGGECVTYYTDVNSTGACLSCAQSGFSQCTSLQSSGTCTPSTLTSCEQTCENADTSQKCACIQTCLGPCANITRDYYECITVPCEDVCIGNDTFAGACATYYTDVNSTGACLSCALSGFSQCTSLQSSGTCTPSTLTSCEHPCESPITSQKCACIESCLGSCVDITEDYYTCITSPCEPSCP